MQNDTLSIYTQEGGQRDVSSLEGTTLKIVILCFNSLFRELSRNLIENIPEGIFQKCRQIEDIELKRNPIRNVQVNAFAHLPNLKKL